MMKTTQIIHREVLKRFPEVKPFLREGDEELPYLVVGAIVRWLSTVAKPADSPEVASRVRAFYDWALDQPRGKSADDDVMTILTVGFVEDLFERDDLLPLIPKLLTKNAMIAGRDYLSQWVGRKRYEKALRLFK
jgi:hypothetical protein